MPHFALANNLIHDTPETDASHQVGGGPRGPTALRSGGAEERRGPPLSPPGLPPPLHQVPVYSLEQVYRKQETKEAVM